MKEKVCLTTFVSGAKYQAFIPFFIYSAKKAYPDYHIILFVHGSLNDHVKEQLKLLKGLGEFEVRENQFEELNISTPLEARTTRWVLPYESFKAFDYAYVVDIDIYYIKEPIPLHQQHVAHMKFTGLPFSNLVRNYKAKAHSPKLIYQRLRDTGPYHFLKFIRAGQLSAKQLSGLHFVEVEPYFQSVKQSQDDLRRRIATKAYRKDILNNDEAFLYDMVKAGGFDMSKLGLMQNSLNMLDFNQPERLEFRPHHGIHLGIFRAKKSSPAADRILQCKEYRYYIDIFKTHCDDPLFIKLWQMGGKTIDTYFKRLFAYYGLGPLKSSTTA